MELSTGRALNKLSAPQGDAKFCKRGTGSRIDGRRKTTN